MIDPVIDPEGNSYEKEAIIEWLSRSQTSPVTRTRLTVDQLVTYQCSHRCLHNVPCLQRPNRALRDMIDSLGTTMPTDECLAEKREEAKRKVKEAMAAEERERRQAEAQAVLGMMSHRCCIPC